MPTQQLKAICFGLAAVWLGPACGQDPATSANPPATSQNPAGTAGASAATGPAMASSPSAASSTVTAPRMPPAMPAPMAAGGPMPVADPKPAPTEQPAAAPASCDPADELPDPEVFQPGMGGPPTGPYGVVVELDPGLPTHTVYRPEKLGDVKHPIVVWENGGCIRNGLWFFPEFLMELASHGSLVVVSGPPNGQGMGMLGVDGAALIDAMDWAIAENDRPCSQYYGLLDPTEVAAMGQSCGGLHAYGAAKDPRVTAVGIWNSGLLERGQTAVYDSLHSPIGFFIGGPDDIAYANAEADFDAITGELPVFYGNLDVGHGGTYAEDNGGEFARVGVAWLRWQLFDDDGPEGGGMFVGPDCGLCNTDWTIEKKNID